MTIRNYATTSCQVEERSQKNNEEERKEESTNNNMNDEKTKTRQLSSGIPTEVDEINNETEL